MKHLHSLVAAVAVLVVALGFVGWAPTEEGDVGPPDTAPPNGTTSESPTVDLPPRGANATARLVESPRHGEWIDINVPGEATKLRTWIVYPERADSAPVVIVIHEIFGLTDWIRAVTDQLAADGFVAVAPDLLSGKGPDGGGTDSFEGDAVRAAIRDLKDDEVVRRLNAVRAHVTALPAATVKCASIGFCWGGTASFMYATAQSDLDAAVVYYGTAPRRREQLQSIACPVLGLYGEADARVTSTVDETEMLMEELDKSFTHHIYEDAGHGFLRQQTRLDGANMHASKQAWAETIRFLRERLEVAQDAQ